MIRSLIFRLVVPVVLVITFGTPAARAQLPVTIAYPSGWNLVSGSQGTDFSTAAEVLTYGNGQYLPAPAAIANPCQGMWAYFAGPATVALAPDRGGTTVACSVPAGWALVGDPFDVPALLPAGVLGYSYDPRAGRYVLGGQIPTGESVWIYSSSARSITLSSALGPAPTTPNLTINALAGSGPYQAHVGNVIEVDIAGNAGFTVAVGNPGNAVLQLIGSGSRQGLSCIGDPACAPGTTTLFWLFKAVSPGAATITLTPACRQTVPPCGAASRLVLVDVLA